MTRINSRLAVARMDSDTTNMGYATYTGMSRRTFWSQTDLTKIVGCLAVRVANSYASALPFQIEEW